MNRIARPIVRGPSMAVQPMRGALHLATEEGVRRDASPLCFDDIYREHAAKVALWARRLLGPHGDVEDVLQEVFLVAHRRLGEYRGEAKITTWLHEITFRVTQNHRRKLRFARWLRLTPALEQGPVDHRTPLHALESRRACELAYRVIDQLPERERAALILFEIDGLSVEEISSITKCTVGTVWVQLSRGRQKLRTAFDRADSGRTRRGATHE